MRVISGKLKGRVLRSFKGQRIRPTTDRVKESVFNIISAHLEGARVLDLFCGTGNLSIEAISWGAQSCVAVDNHRDSINLTKANIEDLEIKRYVKVIQQDVKTYLAKYIAEPFDVIFADPPFTEKMADDVMTWLSKSQCYGPNTIIVIESSSRETIQDEYSDLKCVDRRTYGDKLASFFSKKESAK
ncbi:MAG: 16S rRNA (guanine(966)-N(2))-methyltransferase RsmD [Bdellovibrionales bacterium]|nr:16S rRNA (guanine(966)-N(2))-methyltransferase RsmD [Bdellovibrionales bacterium]